MPETQDTVRELKDLVVTYAKQETLEPLKGLKKFIGFGLGGALLLGTGVFFLAMGALRALQTQTGTTFTGNWSWAPYLIVVVSLALLAVLVWQAGQTKNKKKESA
ncbi:MAG: phage holin family protein [Actinomycetota bacterium]|nr:phage holin family protein [Actinomycetota bacterium]